MAIDVDIKPLAELLDGGFSKSAIRRAFSRFMCKRDSDVSLFLKAHAIQNEGTGASRTYLALSSDALDEDRLEVVAFVTVAVAVTDYTVSWRSSHAMTATHTMTLMPPRSYPLMRT